MVIPYDHIPHPVSSSLDVSNQLTVLEQLGTLRQRYVKYQNDLSFALDHQKQFPGIDIHQVNERYNEISSEITKIVTSAGLCFNDISKCNVPELNLALLENILPPQVEVEFDLGTSWLENEGGYTGVWTRRGNSNTFDAIWTAAGLSDVTAVLTIHRSGNSVIVNRRNSSDGNDCDYTGTISDDGRTVSGTFTCIHGGTTWSATIR